MFVEDLAPRSPQQGAMADSGAGAGQRGREGEGDPELAWRSVWAHQMGWELEAGGVGGGGGRDAVAGEVGRKEVSAGTQAGPRGSMPGRRGRQRALVTRGF